MIRGECAGGHITRGTGGKIGGMTDEVVLFKDWVPTCRGLGSCVLSIKGRLCPVVPRPFASWVNGWTQVRQRVLQGKIVNAQGFLYRLRESHDLVVTKRQHRRHGALTRSFSPLPPAWLPRGPL